MRYFIIAFLSFLFTGCASLNQPAKELSEIAETNAPRVTTADFTKKVAANANGIFKLKSEKDAISSCGTAFLVDIDGKDYICTAYHVISDFGNIRLYNDDDSETPIQTGKGFFDKETDVAIIEAKYVPAETKRWLVNMPRVGQRVELIGFPEDKKRLVNVGVIKSITVEVQGQVKGGMSGGPVIQGNTVVGVITHQVLIDGQNVRARCGDLERVISQMR